MDSQDSYRDDGSSIDLKGGTFLILAREGGTKTESMIPLSKIWLHFINVVNVMLTY